MKIVAEQLWALTNVQQRMRKVRPTNGLKEFLPAEYRAAFGLRNFESGNFFYKGSRSLVTTWNILGPMSSTPWNIRTGMNGGLATAQSRENSILKTDTLEWSMSESDAPSIRFGLSPDSFQSLRWRGSWQRRKTQGWSMSAFWLLIFFGEVRKNIRGWSCGCPCWYSEHQP